MYTLDCKTVCIFGYIFKYARAVKQKVWNESENKERDWGETPHTLRARKTLTPRFTDFFTDFEEKTVCFAVYVHTEYRIAVFVAPGEVIR